MKHTVKCQKECPKWSLSAQTDGPFESRATSKCCDFNPFVSALSLGAWLHEGGARQDLLTWAEPRGLWTLFGLAQPQEEPVRCQFFNPEKGLCRIWRHRPPVCRSYFCEIFPRALIERSFQQERLDMQAEADLLLSWWLECWQGTEELWQAWVKAMETTDGAKSLPADLLLRDGEEALDHYADIYNWGRTQLASHFSL